MRDALSLTDQAIAFGSGQISEPTVRQMLGSVDRSYVFRLLEALALGDGKTVVETSEVLRLNGLSAASTLEEMSSVLQHMAVRQAVPNSPGGFDESDPEAAEVARLAELMPADETQLLYSICLHGRAELGLAPDDYAALTMVLLRLLAFKPPTGQAPGAEKKTLIKAPAPRPEPPTAVPVAVLTAPGVAKVQAAGVPPVRLQAWDEEKNIAQEHDGRVIPATNNVANLPSAIPLPPGQHLHVLAMPTAGSLSASLAHGTSRTPADHASDGASIVAIPVRIQADSRTEAAAGQAPTPVLQASEEGEFWHATIAQLLAAEAITALVRELALQSQLVARDADQWVLRVERESLNQAGTRERLAAALQASGHPVSLAVEIGRVTDSPARRNAAQAAERQLGAEKIIFDAPFVQAMMRDFGAKIVPGSIKPG
jgi:DNA polymerase-3 subunit gamma/tau